MNQQPTEDREREYSERLTRGEPPVDGELEKCIHRAYERNRQALRGMPVPDFDMPPLVDRLLEEAAPRPHPWRSWLGRMPAPAFTAAMAFAFCVAAGSIYSVLRAPGTPPVTSCVLTDRSTGKAAEPPLLWERRLQRGVLVSVPISATANFKLSDGSSIRCTPGAQVAFNMTGERRITLRAGRIDVSAARDPHTPMLVDAGLGTVTVVGTEFSVTLIR